MSAPPFEDSRRLTGPNLYFDGVGAVLETLGPIPGPGEIEAWRERVIAMRHALGWPAGALGARTHARGAALAFEAPLDQLFSATEVNEWAWQATQREADDRGQNQDAIDFHAPGHPCASDQAAALETLRRFAAAERQPTMMALVAAAEAHALGALVDDEEVSLGSGTGGSGWLIDALPSPGDVHWEALHDIPVALVTGSNGKTTTVRLLAAMLRAHGLSCAWSCTDGLFADGVKLRGGDYSGPAGARAVLRHASTQAAVLETARGGLLRRGLAPQRADVAVVTNISVDHFGEYGIHDLAGLADTKLIVARALRAPSAMLVLNADDAVLRARAPEHGGVTGWFALDDAHPWLESQRAQGAATCGVAGGRLQLHWQGARHDLGPVIAMPLSFGGRAAYNIANLAAASLAAAALGVGVTTIAAVCARFGRDPADNPGRLQHRERNGVQVFIDYAHNPDGLHGLLQLASDARAGEGRLGLLLGQAGNREDAEIRELAEVAARFAPDRVVLKDLGEMLRGRSPGEVPALLREVLLQNGLPSSALHTCLDEETAARQLLAWARPGDVVVLPLHGSAAREAIGRVGIGDSGFGIG